jgi:glycosyltransferase involved in cell wall biosynthesis
MLVVNQFWAHKNHIQVVEAMGWLARDRRCPQVVMIGQPSDNRDPTGKALSHLLRRVAELKLEGRVKLLGFVAAAERDALLRSCKALIQPSRCEGRNTSVEDAKALGRPVIASDIPVHREQSPAAFGFAAPDDAEGLAALMERADRELTPGPDPAREQQCLAAARADALDAGRRLWETCREAAGLRTLRRGGPGRTA